MRAKAPGAERAGSLEYLDKKFNRVLTLDLTGLGLTKVALGPRGTFMAHLSCSSVEMGRDDR